MGEPTGPELRALLAPLTEGDVLFVEGFDDALLGLADGWFHEGHRTVAVYDRERCLRILEAADGDPEGAEEYFDYNMAGAYVGPGTPVFVTLYRKPDLADPRD